MAAYGREMKLLLSLCPAAAPAPAARMRCFVGTLSGAIGASGGNNSSRSSNSSSSCCRGRIRAAAATTTTTTTRRSFSSSTLPPSHPRRTQPLDRLSQPRPSPPAPWHLHPSRRWFTKKLIRPATAKEQQQEQKSASSIVTDYEDLPSSYRDAEGLPFLPGDAPLSDAKVRAVFGRTIEPAAANRLLRILHGRRVAGTLEDPRFWPNTAEYGDAAVDKALAHLRAAVPADEVMNAGLRAQDELDEMDREQQREAAAQGKADPVPEPDPVYGYASLDANRARNRARAEARDRRDQEERDAKGLPPVMGPLEVIRQPRPLSPRMQRWTELATSTIQEPPQISHWERLGPSAAFFVLVVGCLAAVTLVYEPPPDKYRLFPLVEPASATVGAIVLLNLMVWCMWRVPPLWPIMNRHFFIVHGYPRATSLMLSVFSHQSIGHLFVNMSALWLFGTMVHDEVGGRAAFLTLYFGAGMLGMLASMAWLTLRGVLVAASLGASGAAYGAMGAYFWLHRTDTFKAWGLPPEPFNGIPGVVFLALMAGANLGSISNMLTSKVDKFSHIAGALFGVAFGEFMARRLRQARALLGGEEGEVTAMMQDEQEEGLVKEDYVEWNVIDIATGQSRLKRELRKKAEETRTEPMEEVKARTVPKVEEVKARAEVKMEEAKAQTEPKTDNEVKARTGQKVMDKDELRMEEERKRQILQVKIMEQIKAERSDEGASA